MPVIFPNCNFSKGNISKICNVLKGFKFVLAEKVCTLP